MHFSMAIFEAVIGRPSDIFGGAKFPRNATMFGVITHISRTSNTCGRRPPGGLKSEIKYTVRTAFEILTI